MREISRHCRWLTSTCSTFRPRSACCWCFSSCSCVARWRRKGAHIGGGVATSVARRMDSSGHLAIFVPLAMSSASVFCTVIVHALSLQTIIHFVRRERRLGLAGVKFWRNVSDRDDWGMGPARSASAGDRHLGVVLQLCGVFGEFTQALYHSAGNYTTLGAGDMVISPSWRLLGPLEAANGMLNLVSTAIIFAEVERLVQARFGEMK